MTVQASFYEVFIKMATKKSPKLARISAYLRRPSKWLEGRGAKHSPSSHAGPWKSARWVSQRHGTLNGWWETTENRWRPIEITSIHCFWYHSLIWRAYTSSENHVFFMKNRKFLMIIKMIRNDSYRLQTSNIIVLDHIWFVSDRPRIVLWGFHKNGYQKSPKWPLPWVCPVVVQKNWKKNMYAHRKSL